MNSNSIERATMSAHEAKQAQLSVTLDRLDAEITFRAVSHRPPATLVNKSNNTTSPPLAPSPSEHLLNNTTSTLQDIYEMSGAN
jgi:hypothetical protein